MKILFSIFVFSLSVFLTQAQQTYINQDWENSFGQTAVIDRAVSALDSQDNVITVSNKLNASLNTDIYVTKYDRNGDFVWDVSYDGTAHDNDFGVNLVIDGNDNIFVCGAVENTGSMDINTIKYNSSGVLQWSQSWDGQATEMDIPSAIDIDEIGNVYVSGGTETSNGYSDYVVLKYNSSGTFQWASTYDYNNLYDGASSLDADTTNVVVTGASASDTTSWDYATLRLDVSNGDTLYTERTAVSGVGLDNAAEITTDASNNVYVTGYVEVGGQTDIQTLKLSPTLGLTWVKTFDGGNDDEATAIEVDDSGNVYVSGTSHLDSIGSDYITIKYDSSGNMVWEKMFGGEGGSKNAIAKDMCLDDSSNVVVAGNISDGTTSYVTTIMYDSDGDLILSRDFDADGSEDNVQKITARNSEIYITGTSLSGGLTKTFITKYSLFEKPESVITDSSGFKYNDSQLIVRFDTSAVLLNTIDDKNITAGVLSDFVEDGVITQMKQKVGFECKDLPTYKIFLRMTSGDSLSISRLGDTVRVDDHWATLSIFIDEADNEFDVIDSLNTLDRIHYAELNYYLELTDVPNDPLYNADQTGLHHLEYGINVQNAWDIQTGQNYINVGIFDNGINWAHEDFGDGSSTGTKVVGGHDYFTPTSNIYTASHGLGHGSIVGGIVGALRNNSRGGAGIAGGSWSDGNNGVNLYSMKLTNSLNIAYDVVLPAIVDGALSTGFGLDIQNHSWAFGADDPDISQDDIQALRAAVTTCYQNNCLYVTSAGNTESSACDENPCTMYPSSFDDKFALVVGASNNNISNVGVASFSVHGNNIDLVAPGHFDSYIGPVGGGNFYGSAGSGTSFSTPHVAGVASLLLSEHNTQNPYYSYPNNLSVKDVEYILSKYATDITTTVGYDIQSGHGLTNANIALQNTSLPGYMVRHGGPSPNSSSTNTSTNQTVVLVENINGVAAGLYTGVEKHVKTRTYNITLPSGHNVIDEWKRKRISRGFSQVNPIVDQTDFTLSVTQNGTDVTVTTGVTCWYIPSLQIWLPTHISFSSTHFSLQIETNETVSIDENEINLSYTVFPNPSEGLFNINYYLQKESDVIINIYDTKGSIVYSKVMENQVLGQQQIGIDVTNLSSGLYVTHLVINGENVISKKIVIE